MAAFPEIENPSFTSSGVPFEYQFEDYAENTNLRAGNAMIRARCGWGERIDFATDAVGYATGTPGGAFLNRQLPLQHPEDPSLWCSDAKLIDYAVSDPATANVYGFGQDPATFDPPNGMFAADWAIFGLTFSRMPFPMIDNITAGIFAVVYPTTPPEMARYFFTDDRPRAREFSTNSFQLCQEGVTTNVLPITAFIMDREQDVVMTTLQFPADSIPWTAIGACLGLINDAELKVPVAYTPPATWTFRTFPQDSLLFRGVAQTITKYPGPNGVQYVDLPFFFTYRATTWRKLPNPDQTSDRAPITVVFKGSSPTKYLYDRTDFAKLFKPEP